MIQETDVIVLLNAFIDPLTGEGLVKSNRVSGLVIKGGQISFALTIPPQARQLYASLTGEIEKKIKESHGVKSCHIILTNERAPVQRLPDLEKIKNIIVVGSGKGGVGKSTVSLNLALGLAAKGLRVGLLDADIYGPSLPTMLNINQLPESRNKTLIPIETQGIKFISIGLLIPDHSSIVWRGPMIQKALIQMLWGTDWGVLDALVIDLPPGTGDIQITLCQKARLSGAIIVSTPQDLSLLDARKAVDMFQKVNVSILGIIENMSQFICPHCEKATPIFDHGGVEAEASFKNLPFLGSIPLSIKLREDKHVPLLFEDMVNRLIATLE